MRAPKRVFTPSEKAAANERALRESAKKALDDRLNELDHRIAALRADAKPATKKAKTDLDHEIARLQSEAADLRAKLSTDAGRTETWDKVKRATEETLDKLERKLNDLSPKK